LEAELPDLKYLHDIHDVVLKNNNRDDQFVYLIAQVSFVEQLIAHFQNKDKPFLFLFQDFLYIWRINRLLLFVPASPFRFEQ